MEVTDMFGKKKQPKEYEIWKTRVKYFQFPRFMKGISEWLEYMSGNSVGVRVEVKSYSHIYSNGDCVDIIIYGPCITGLHITELTEFIRNQPMEES
jgi:hypothetical protein